jgi:feruloyl esterase
MSTEFRTTNYPITAPLCLVIIGLAGCVGTGASGKSSTVAASTAPAPTEQSCIQLTARRFEGVDIKSAAVVPANTSLQDARRPDMTGEPHGVPVNGLPAICRVIGELHSESQTSAHFEVWMPMQGWNGRFFGANNGGFAGSLRYDDLAAAVLNGGAGTSSDAGHSSSDRAWAQGRPDRVRDYGWQATHFTAVKAKEIVAAFYGRGPEHAYFVGCSNGGRQGLLEAGRFPEDYDGVVAGAPVASWTETAMSGLNVYRAQQAPGATIRKEQAAFLQSEFLRQCDAIDGQMDGLVFNPLKCHFDYSKLTCGVSTSLQCFTPPQIAALKQIQAGPHDEAGRRVAYGYTLSGAEIGVGNVGWDSALFSPRGSMFGALQSLTNQSFGSQDTFDFNTDTARLKAALAADLDPQPDLRRFFDRGGKLIIWHGWADAVLQPEATLAFYQEALRKSGSRAKSSSRLFMIPGVDHCSGGPGADSFGQIGAAPAGASPERNVAAALVTWVENGRAPETLVGRHGALPPPGTPATNASQQFERLHCAYPYEPILRSGGDINTAADYTCKKAK